MIRMLFYLLLFFPLLGQGQDSTDIQLSKTLDENRMGKWIQGDYEIRIELDTLEAIMREYGKSCFDAAMTYAAGSIDSVNYVHSGNRFMAAAEQLKQAENDFDLKTLVVYYGPPREIENPDNASMTSYLVRLLVEGGQAQVHYKGKRIDSLKYTFTSDGPNSIYGYTVMIYYDDAENCLYQEYYHQGW
ncbi:MAG: hypothetical protein ACKVOR_01470 [Flavobacteriales bacterium]